MGGKQLKAAQSHELSHGSPSHIGDVGLLSWCLTAKGLWPRQQGLRRLPGIKERRITHLEDLPLQGIHPSNLGRSDPGVAVPVPI